MIEWLICHSCGQKFRGMVDKEDTCPECLKKLINLMGLTKEHKKELQEDFLEDDAE